MESVQRMFTNHTEEVEKFVSLVKKAILLSDISIDNVHAIENELGGGWIAEETVAIAIYCTLSYFDNFERAMIAAVNHAGDSDSTGAVTGNLLGAAIGYNAIPQFYKNDLELHDVIDNIENELRETLGCEATIHMDPVVTSDEHVSETKAAMVSLIKAIDEDLSIHDFRMVSGGTHTNLIFDILAPFGFRLTDEELLTEVLQSVHEHFGDNYYVVTKIDHSYI